MNKQNLHTLIKMTLLFALIFSSCGGAVDVVNNEADNNGGYDYSFDNNTAENRVNAGTDGEYAGEANYAEAPSSGYVDTDDSANYDYAADEREGVGGGAYAEPIQPLPSQAESVSGDSPYKEPGVGGYNDNDPYDSTTFQNYGTNPFVDTDYDALSTFAMDVDTGAYAVSRNYLNDGYRPPQNAVRVEEFINYFDYQYPAPKRSNTFGINLDGAPTPFTEGRDYDVLRVGIQGIEVSSDERDDLVLTFVIDVSGSMEEGGRLELVKDALRLLVNELRRSDVVTIIAYSDSAWVVLEPTQGDKHNRINGAINELRPTYSTNAEAGLRLGYKYADRTYTRGATNRVILLSDGVANVGNTGQGSIWETIERFAGNDIHLTTVGVGMGNYNDVLLEQLADKGNGFYSYIDTMDEAERLFVDDFTGTLQTIAKDAKVQVTFNPNVVERYRLLGYENREVADEDFDDPNVDAGEVGAGHSVTALYEIKLYEGAKGEVATVTLHWEDPDSGRLYEIDESIDVRDFEKRFDGASPSFQQAVVVAEFAEILRGSYFAEDGSLSELLDAADYVYGQLEYSQDFGELIDLIVAARRAD